MVNQPKWEIEVTPGVWLDITTDVYQRDTPSIVRGRADEQGSALPGNMAFTLDNRDGKFSTRNPLSPLYGQIGRNTPVRCTLDNGAFTRFRGELSGLPPRWDASQVDNHIPVEAFGLLRRLSRPAEVVSNALRDWIEFRPTLMAYYPMIGGEDKTFSQNLAPGKTGSFFGSPGAVFTYGVDMPGAPWLGTGMELNDTAGASYYMQGYIDGPPAGSGDNVALDFVFQSPALGVLDIEIWPGASPDPITVTGDPKSHWTLRLNTSADAGTAFVFYTEGASGGSDTGTTPVAVAALQDTAIHTCRFELRMVADGPGPVGPGVEYYIYIDGQLVEGALYPGLNVGIFKAFAFRFHYDRFVNQTVMNIAHVAVWVDNTAANLPLAADYAAAAFSYAGETALDRLTRIAAAGGIPINLVGTAADSMPMGPSFAETRLDQIREVEATDMGILVEQRDAMSLQYLARTSLYNQTPQFTLNYQARQISPPLEPIEDDQLTANDVTATRREGGSDRYVATTGRLGTADPPTGVGVYATDFTVNPETDDWLILFASWVASIGTLDQPRWPAVTVNLNNPTIPAALRTSILNADVGDLFVITGMRSVYYFDDVRLIIVGYYETITPFSHIISFNCMPAEPYEVFVVESTGSRISSGETAVVNATMTTTATSMSILSSDSTTLWTTAGGDMPMSVMLSGEELTITAISGTTPGVAQTATVVRSVNGVVKAHSSGEIVRFKRRAALAL